MGNKWDSEDEPPDPVVEAAGVYEGGYRMVATLENIAQIILGIGVIVSILQIGAGLVWINDSLFGSMAGIGIMGLGALNLLGALAVRTILLGIAAIVRATVDTASNTAESNRIALRQEELLKQILARQVAG